MTSFKLFFWYVFMFLGGLFVLISNFVIEMPYQKWLAESLPVWIGILDISILGSVFVIMAMPKPPLLSILGTIGLASALMFKPCFSKAPVTNGIILSFATLIFVTMKYYYRKKR